MPADDDEGSGPPPHPLDRVWFHPSELGSSVGTLRPQPASPTMWIAALVALLIGVSGTLGVVTAIGGFSGSADRSSTSAAVTAPPLADPDAVATLVTTVGRSIVTLSMTPAEGGEPSWTGSGVVVREGQVLTAAHVLTGGGTPSVVTAGGQVAPATVVGIDHETDLALLRIEGVDLVPARLSADTLRVGKSVAALAAGPAPDRWVSAGVISGLHRVAPLTSGVQGTGLIETDAEFGGTAAGGALLDHTGAVIGVLTGPGRYAVPIDVARVVADQLNVNGSAAHGWTGVVGTDVLDRPGGGVRIRGIVDGSPAQAAGLQIDDVVLGVGDGDVGNIGELVASIRKLRPGDPVEITVMRGSQRRVIDVTLGTSIPTPSDWLVAA